ncbi:MAG: rane protein [Ilumatobacteraceae bacterium]|nr:rane protein [Ilumatobacteraceae bacterium]MCU1389098.1 rane protein [Ilumatobacteraceae bacterium]
MMRKLLVRGLLAGLLAGLFGFGVAKIMGEPQVEKAVAFERYVADNIHHEAPDADLVSRSVQSSAGLGTGALIYGIALGGISALVFAGIYGRGGMTKAKPTAALVGLCGFVAVYLVPVLKYPANPPAIGQADTIGRRTALFVLMIVISVAGMTIAAIAWRRLIDRTSRWNATLSAGLIYVAIIAIAYVALPGINEVPQAAIPGITNAVTDATITFPPTILWKFRVASILIQLILWTGIGLTFGWLAERLLEPVTRPARRFTRARVDDIDLAAPR